MTKILFSLGLAVLGMTAISGCGSSGASDGTASQIVAGAIGGPSNDNAAGASQSFAYAIPKEHPTWISRLKGAFDLFPDALAFQISCSGGSLSPSSYAPGTTFQWTPISCSLTYRNGKQASVQWSSYFDLNYGSSCTGSSFQLSSQPSGCVVTRTTPTGGNTRTLTRQSGQSHAVNIDTTSPGGWDSSISTNSGGTVISAEGSGSSGFSARQIAINGTHLTSTLDGQVNWNHTVSTDPNNPLEFVGVGASKVLTSGTVILQHNLAKFTSSSVVQSPLVFSNVNCCFPTSGSVETTFHGGPYDGKTETIEFSSDCGEATLVNSAGVSSSVTLSDCL
jgi:hypothetical protein